MCFVGQQLSLHYLNARISRHKLLLTDVSLFCVIGTKNSKWNGSYAFLQ